MREKGLSRVCVCLEAKKFQYVEENLSALHCLDLPECFLASHATKHYDFGLHYS